MGKMLDKPAEYLADKIGFNTNPVFNGFLCISASPDITGSDLERSINHASCWSNCL